MEFQVPDEWFTPVGTNKLRDVEAELRRRNQERIAKEEVEIPLYTVDLKDPEIWELLQIQMKNLGHRLIWGGMRDVIFSLQENPKYKDVVEDLPTSLQIIYKLDPEDPKFRDKSNEIARRNQLKMTFDRDALLSSCKSSEEGGDHEAR